MWAGTPRWRTSRAARASSQTSGSASGTATMSAVSGKQQQSYAHAREHCRGIDPVAPADGGFARSLSSRIRERRSRRFATTRTRRPRRGRSRSSRSSSSPGSRESSTTLAAGRCSTTPSFDELNFAALGVHRRRGLRAARLLARRAVRLRAGAGLRRASSFRQARHIVGLAAAPLALSLLLVWPVRLAIYGGDVFRRRRLRHGRRRQDLRGAHRRRVRLVARARGRRRRA